MRDPAGVVYPTAISEWALNATLDRRLGERWTLQGGLGVVGGGDFGGEAISPGGVVSVGASYVFLTADGARPFVLGSLGASYSLARVGSDSLHAGDVRVGAVAGWTFGGRVTPYATARLFGGPVIRGDRLGGDAYHYQLGAGAVFTLPWGLDASVEVVPLGEQRVSAGIGLAL